MNDYHRIHQTFPGYQAMPLIGLPNEPTYIDSVLQAGGAPLVIPSGQSADGLVNILNTLDGILTTESQESLLTLLASNRQIPILTIDEATDSNAICTFMAEATSFMEAKRLHNRILTLDSHCDTPMFFDQEINFASRDPKILVDLHKMTEGHLDATIMVAYLEQQGLTDEDLMAATAKADRILNEIEAMVSKSSAHVNIAYTPADLYRLKSEGKKAIMMGIENGYAIGKDIANVERFRNRGIVYMTLCHNGNNQLCGSCRDNEQNSGVNAFGEQVIQEMNRVGMMVDISHAGVQTFYDALEISTKPIVASHSSARALCNHPRNLYDDQMRALAAKGGVAQVTLYNGFLKEVGQATIEDAIAHLNHMVDVMGIEHVGIGTDFDGDGGIIGCASASELINFTRHLLKERYSEEDIRRIWGGNFLRVMEEVQKV
ncbi:MAG: membrane dipeptidase [Bacteroidaceae bacterium]|nr:membrane dipeptidase [Bacteroidaceae bacterium]